VGQEPRWQVVSGMLSANLTIAIYVETK